MTALVGVAAAGLLALGISPAPAALHPLEITSVAEATGATPRFERFEASIELSETFADPFDPNQIAVDVTLTSPGGRVQVVPAFWYEPFTASGVTYETYSSAGAPGWRVRFAPGEVGTYTYSVAAVAGSRSATPVTGSFEATASTLKGFVRTDDGNSRYLRFDNGTPYVPVGHNLAFEDGNPELNGVGYYDDLLGSLGRAGENWSRVWMTDFNRSALEWGEGHYSGFYHGPGVYSLPSAWRMDRILELAEENGVAVQLVLNDHGQFSNRGGDRWAPRCAPEDIPPCEPGDPGFDPGSAYSDANGGPVPLARPDLFFSNADARELMKKRMRYIVARYGAFRSVLAWELFNEVQFVGTPAENPYTSAQLRSDIVDWHADMAQYLKTTDPFGHLVTTSSAIRDTGGIAELNAMWALPAIDVVQIHWYEPQPELMTTDVPVMIHQLAVQYGKPVVVGELGLPNLNPNPEPGFNPATFGGSAADREHLAEGTHLHNAMWAAAVNGSGAGYWWWGNYIAAETSKNRIAPAFPLNEHLAPPLLAYLQGEDFAPLGLDQVSIDTAGSILATGVASSSRAYVWVRDAQNEYGTGSRPGDLAGRTIVGAQVTITGLADGGYLVRVYDTWGSTGVTSSFTAVASGGSLTVSLPAFQRDVALKVAALSGKLLYYTSGLQIFDFDPSQGSRLLASGGYGAKYSADGTKIAFSGYSPACGLKVMDADGSNPETVASATACDYQSPSFSPDGTKLAFVRQLPNSSAIGVIGVDGSNETTIVPAAPPGGFYNSPVWSPDGQKIAFSGAGTYHGNSDIYTVNADGSGLTNLTSTPDGTHYFNAPDWAPDGSQLVFTQNGAGQEGWVSPGVWMMNADGSNLHPINLGSPGCGGVSAAVWSPDGQKIAYSQRTGMCGPGTVELFTMDLDGSNRVQLTNGGYDKYLSDWQPTVAGGPVEVPQAPPLANTLRNVQGFDVAADGTMALVGVRSGEPDYGQTDLYRLPPGGGVLARVTFDGLSEGTPSIANDHRVSYAPGGQTIVVRNGDGSGRVQLAPTSYSCGYASPAISPDGSFVVYSNYCGGVHHVGTDGANDQVLPVPSGIVFYAGDISPDGTRVAGQCYDSTTYESGICTFGAADGSNFAWALLNGSDSYWSEPSWSPNGSLLAVTLGDGSRPITEIYVASADGSAATLVPTSDTGYKYNPRWLPDGSIAYVHSTSEDGSTSEIRIATPPIADTDSDGIVDPSDNCPSIANSDQNDADGDNIGDVCDDDYGRSLTDQPDDFSGPQVHLVYVLPSDGVDRRLDLDGTIAGTVAVAQDWLRGKTGGRGFRLDTAGGEPDITFFRMSQTDAQIAATGAYVRDTIEDELVAAGFDDADKLYSVYYDGSSTWSCGGGAWPPILPGTVAALYLNGFEGLPYACINNPFATPGGQPGYWEFSFIHELVHTLGFVATCAPNETLGGHVDAPTNDLMYAGTAPWNLSGVVLDDGNDDYFHHPNPGCPDLEDSPFLEGSPPNPDPDGDGVADAIGAGSPGAWDDGAGSFGSIVTVPAGVTILVEGISPDGVRISVSGTGTEKAVFSVCGFPGTLKLAPGSVLDLSCSSVDLVVIIGVAEYELPGGLVVSVPAGVSARISDSGGGRFAVENLGGGELTLTVGGVTTPVSVGGPLNVILGTSRNEKLTGTAGDDLIVGNGGNDQIDGKGGNDTIRTGKDNDEITTGSGNDTITDSGGNNTIDTGDGNDLVTTGTGNDKITTRSGNDTIEAGGGNNTIDAGAGNDRVSAGPGNDTIDGGPGTDTCTPGSGKNKVKNCETLT